jgi:acylpyruvate hydrolase
MRLASFVDPQLGNEARFGIISGDHLVDVVLAANALRRAVPATSVKLALTSGAHTLAALSELVAAAERAKLLRPIRQSSSASARTPGSTAKSSSPTRC